MSILAPLLGWSKLPQWALELIAMAAVGLGVWWWHHETYQHGIAAQIASDKAAALVLQRKADADTARAAAAAEAAENAYVLSQNDLAQYRARHPLGSVRLCDASPGYLSETGPHHPGNAHPSPIPGAVQRVPAGDPGVRGAQHPDIAGLLDALAGRADQVSAELTEYQRREQ